MKKTLAATRNFGRWFDIEVVKLPEIIFGIAMLEKTLLGCSEMKVSLRTHW